MGLHQHFFNFQIPAHPQAPMLSLAAATPPLTSPEISARAVSLAMGMPNDAPGISMLMENAAVQDLPTLCRRCQSAFVMTNYVQDTPCSCLTRMPKLCSRGKRGLRKGR